jgi:hypothetical protein
MSLIPRSAVAAAPLALALSLAFAVGASAQVASLSGPDETPPPEAAVGTELEFADFDEALLAFVQCLRDNGLEVDDPVAGEGGRGFLRGGGGGAAGLDRQSEEFQAAQAECGLILESSRPDIDPAAEQERLETELLLAQCLRDNGYPEYPDPALDNDGRLQRGGQAFQAIGIDRRSAEFQNARGTCADDLGVEAFGPGGGAGNRGGN